MLDFLETPGPVLTEVGSIYDYTATQTQVLQATGEEAFAFNPVPALWRFGKRAAAENIYGTRISADEAKRRVAAAKLPLNIPESGITEEELQMLMDSKQAELERKQILARSPGGFALGAAQLGTGLVVSMFDPINIASGFGVGGAMRIVGAGEMANTMRIASKVRWGIAEGAVGAAVIEPFLLGMAYDEQADYTMLDSVLNIGFGAAIGGVTHGVVGYLGARAEKMKRRERLNTGLDRISQAEADALDAAAVGQLANDTPLNLEPVIKIIKRDRQTTRTETARIIPPDVEEAGRVAGIEMRLKLVDAEAARLMDDIKTGNVDKLSDDMLRSEAALRDPETFRKAENLDMKIERLQEAINDATPENVREINDLREKIDALETKLADENIDRRKAKNLQKERVELISKLNAIGDVPPEVAKLREALLIRQNERARLGPDIKKATDGVRGEAPAAHEFDIVSNKLDEIAERRMKLEDELLTARARDDAPEMRLEQDLPTHLNVLSDEARTAALNGERWENKIWTDKAALDRARDRLDAGEKSDPEVDVEIATLREQIMAEIESSPELKGLLPIDDVDMLDDQIIKAVSDFATCRIS
jgi:hypothetical protein